jgi:hypothetical protein
MVGKFAELLNFPLEGASARIELKHERGSGEVLIIKTLNKELLFDLKYNTARRLTSAEFDVPADLTRADGIDREVAAARVNEILEGFLLPGRVSAEDLSPDFPYEEVILRSTGIV